MIGRSERARRLHRGGGGRRRGIGATTGPRRFVLRTAWQGRRRILPAVLLTGTHQLCEVAVPVVVGTAIDRGVVAGDPARLLLWLAVLVGVFSVLATSYRVGALITLRGAEEVAHSLRMRVTSRILDPRGFGDRARPVGELLGIGGSDVRAVAGGMSLLVFPLAELAAVVAAGLVLVGVAWPLGVAVIVGGPLFLVALDRCGGALRARVETEQSSVADSATLAADAIAGHRTLSALGATERAAERYRSASERARRAALASRRAEALLVALTSASTGIFIASIGLAAAFLAVDGVITIGQLITTVGVVTVVMGPLEALSVNVVAVWSWAVASGSRVLSLLGAPFVRAASPRAPSSDVHSGRGDGLRMVALAGERLRGIDVGVAPGELVGLVADGASGAELVALLDARIPPRGGAILSSGVELRLVDGDRLPGCITVAPHAAHVLEGTVLENVVGPAGAGGTSRALAALHAAAFDDVLQTLPRGVQSRLGPSGRSLSGGQRQRLGLARALAAEAAVLVLHDPTTSVDAVTELTIAGRLRAATTGRATLLVSTSPQLLAVADRVLQLDGGIVVAEGTHAELLASRPDYAHMVS